MRSNPRGISDSRLKLVLAVKSAVIEDAQYALQVMHAKPVDVLHAVNLARDVLERELKGLSRKPPHENHRPTP